MVLYVQGNTFSILADLSDASYIHIIHTYDVDVEPADFQLALTDVLSSMVDPHDVSWAPEFSCALVAGHQSMPRAQTVIFAVCLDNWESQTHRCEHAACHFDVCMVSACDPWFHEFTIAEFKHSVVVVVAVAAMRD